MTCNPFGSIASKYSPSVLTIDNIDILSFDEILDFEKNASLKYDDDKLKEACLKLNNLFNNTDLSDYPTLKDKNSQMDSSCLEVAEFLDSTRMDLDFLLNELDKELANRNPNPIIENTLVSVDLVSYDNQTPPGIYTDLGFRDATFDVLVGANGLPILNIIDPGSNFRVGELITLEEIRTVYRVSDVTNISGITRIPGVSDISPILSEYDYFLNDNLGPSITGRQCSTVNLNFLAAIFAAGKFIAQSPNLLSDIWGDISSFTKSLPSLLGNLKDQLFSVIDTVKNRALNFIENAKATITSLSRGFSNLNKKLQDVGTFFSDANINKVKGLAERLMSNMFEQFEANPETSLDVVQWILSRICQMSSFLSDFMQSPIDSLSSLISEYQYKTNVLRSASGRNSESVILNGGLRGDYNQLRERAERVANNSNNANATPLIQPARYVTLDISNDERNFVISNLSRNGIPGRFVFIGNATNPAINKDFHGNPFPDASWKLVNVDVYAALIRISNRMNTAFSISSAYRDIVYNSSIGGAGTSAHLSGIALDISMAGIDIPRFIQIASQEGFTGISQYPNSNSRFVHIDIKQRSRGERTWQTAGSQSPEIRRAIQLHVNDQFRNGQT